MDEAGRVEVARPVDGLRPLHALLRANVGDPVAREPRRGAVEPRLDHELALALQRRPQRRKPGERKHGLVLAGGEEIGLVCDAAQRRPLDLAARQQRAEHERQADGEDDDQDDRREQPRSQRVEPDHCRAALYPAPRTVRISSGRPSLRRSCATWTSTVRVPP